MTTDNVRYEVLKEVYICPQCGEQTWYPMVGVCTTCEDYLKWNPESYKNGLDIQP